MKNFEYVITDEVGIHARPAGLLVKVSKDYSSTIIVKCGDKSADAKKLLAVMSLGVKKGQNIEVSVEGDDEDTAVAALETFFKENL
jgi:phosphocarrier protein HPr